MNTYEKYKKDVDQAVQWFWQTRSSQSGAQLVKDAGTRGAVTGGKQLDAFLLLLKKIAMDLGVPESNIHLKGNQLPGYFRATKDWDFIISTPNKHLICCIELKSQVGSFGNNFNNRTEEAIGSAVDLWTAYREGVFPPQQQPWVGYILLVQENAKSTAPVGTKEPFFKALPEFKSASYLKRYEILCRKLVLERHYSSAGLISTSYENETAQYGTPENEASFTSFLDSYEGHILGKLSEFDAKQ
ncbi:MAG TPA: PaeR7I family type II restriction endonuclease [Candidatus Limnocylindria bacterium]|nr:PaeR7I family type II restriction endonuclease [Candidatus Limnocylindria bacterium]